MKNTLLIYKRFLQLTSTLVVFALLVFGLCACTSASSASSNTSTTQQADSTTTTDTAEAQSGGYASAGTQTDSTQTTADSTSAGTASNNTTEATITSTQIQVTVNVDTTQAHGYDSKWPETLGSFSVSLAQNATVYDALKATGLRIGGTKSYITSIGSLAEKECGAQSGWKYSVNGDNPSKACNTYKLSAGDVVCWYYALTV